jgi:hypothetical protein
MDVTFARWRRAHALAAALLLVSSAAAAPGARAENSVTVFGGWRASSSFDDDVAQRKVRLRDRAAGSLAFDFALDPSRQLELFASQQSTSLAVTEIGTNDARRLPVKVTYLHVGGTNFFDGPTGNGPYVAGGLGLTRLTPGLSGFESETKASLSLGLGYMLPFGRFVALRIEGRGYWTLINSSSSLFCSGGCTITIKGDTLQQVEMMLGLSVRF